MDIYENLEFILKNGHKPLLVTETIYDIEKLREISKKYNSTEFSKQFEKGYALDRRFLGFCKCNACESIVNVRIGKVRYIEIINSGLLCEMCIDAINKANEERKRKLAEDNKKDYEELTNTFIDGYLNPKMNWKKIGVDSIKILSHEYNNAVIKSKVIDYIKTLKYYDFLETPYWKAIAWEVKRRAGFRCAICNSNENLATHHRTYEIHGKEIDNLKELTCLCENCHQTHHDNN